MLDTQRQVRAQNMYLLQQQSQKQVPSGIHPLFSMAFSIYANQVFCHNPAIVGFRLLG